MIDVPLGQLIGSLGVARVFIVWCLGTSSRDPTGVEYFEEMNAGRVNISLKRIGAGTFENMGVDENSIHEGVRVMSQSWFFKFCILSRVIFGPLSPIEQIGVHCFYIPNYMSIPNSVREWGTSASSARMFVALQLAIRPLVIIQHTFVVLF